jgi:hypothetical protein
MLNIFLRTYLPSSLSYLLSGHSDVLPMSCLGVCFLLSSKRSFCILGTSPLSAICFKNVFSQPIAYLFAPLPYFEEQTFLPYVVSFITTTL